MKISVVIPTWNRTDFLEKAFTGLQAQSRKPDEIIVGVRTSDQATLDWLETQEIYNDVVKTALVEVPGVVASMQAGADLACGDIICDLDDDAEPFPDWLNQIEATFSDHPELGALGGRDLIMYIPEQDRDRDLTPKVGLFSWYGRKEGNHHRGSGGFRYNHIVKGCNSSYRGELLKKIGYDFTLRGAGAQSHWETALSLDIQNAGYRIAYDPRIVVKHHVAPRHGTDQNHRGLFNAQGVHDEAHNEAYVFHTRVKGVKWIVWECYAWLIGTKHTTGISQWIRFRLKGDKSATARLRATLSGRMEGIKTARKTKRAQL